MAEFYHVSKADISKITSFEKKLIDHEYWYVEDPGKFTKEEYTTYLNSLFPNGTTLHGEKYMLSRWPNGNGPAGDVFVGNDSSMEAIFEIIRMYKFPTAISRFLAVFGCKSIEDARTIRDTTFRGQGKIYKVECDNFFEADMRLLQTGHFFTSAIMYAEKYWSGEKSEKPLIEVLMDPPVKIICIVE